MNAEALGWSEFYVAAAGASAALAGLIIVAMSVNIKDVLAYPSIAARAAVAIGSLAVAVASCCFGLFPEQPLWALGLEVLVLSAALWFLWALAVRAVRADRGDGRPVLSRLIVETLAPALFGIAGVILLAGSTAGLFVLGVSAIVAVIGGVLFAWIALVEVLR